MGTVTTLEPLETRSEQEPLAQLLLLAAFQVQYPGSRVAVLLWPHGNLMLCCLQARPALVLHPSDSLPASLVLVPVPRNQVPRFLCFCFLGVPVQADLSDIVGSGPGCCNKANITKFNTQMLWFPRACESYA